MTLEVMSLSVYPRGASKKPQFNVNEKMKVNMRYICKVGVCFVCKFRRLVLDPQKVGHLPL